MEFIHKPVLLKEAVSLLNVKENGIYIDGTLGGGGHTRAILQQNETARVIGIDRDTDAITAASSALTIFAGRVTICHGNFSNAPDVLNKLGIDKVNGVLLDLGVSSFQLDTPERGFSYHNNAPLDMRMDTTQFLNARQVVNEYSEKELYRVIKDYGEELFASKIAQLIVRQRQKAPIETTLELAELVKKAIPTRARHNGPHPARRTFMALRIEVNNELSALEGAVKGLVERLVPGGRICVITFHSLEDRIIKHLFRRLTHPCVCPPDAPICVCGQKPLLKLVGKAVEPSNEELIENNRAKSARLRVAEKLGE